MIVEGNALSGLSGRERFGFKDGRSGAHMSRTMMLEELGLLLENVGNTKCAPDDIYWDLIVA